MFSMEVALSVVGDLLDSLHLSQVELAAALNVSQPAVSQWARRVRVPAGDQADRLARAATAMATGSRVIGTDRRGRPIIAPDQCWTPAFVPAGKFRLPLHIEWSGSDRSRWRDATNAYDLLDAYMLVLSEGRVADMVTWVDPAHLAGSFDEAPWPRSYRGPWRNLLGEWGLI